MNEFVPDNVLGIVREQANRIASNRGSALSLGIVVGILVSLWSAISGVKAMIDALNVIYQQKESRSFIKLNLVALAFTLGGFAAFLLAIASIIVLPLILSPIGFGNVAETLTRVARWPVLLILLLIGLAVLYRYGPDRRTARWQWVTVGSAFAAMTWIIASFLFSWYLASFANYNATYGSLGAAVGVMIWLWISATVMLLGAELNAEIEHQTARDSTVGAEKPWALRRSDGRHRRSEAKLRSSARRAGPPARAQRRTPLSNEPSGISGHSGQTPRRRSGARNPRWASEPRRAIERPKERGLQNDTRLCRCSRGSPGFLAPS